MRAGWEAFAALLTLFAAFILRLVEKQETREEEAGWRIRDCLFPKQPCHLLFRSCITFAFSEHTGRQFQAVFCSVEQVVPGARGGQLVSTETNSDVDRSADISLNSREPCPAHS